MSSAGYTATVEAANHRRIYTPEIMPTVRRWVEVEGASAEVVAARLGSTPGTVRVKCSKAGIRFQKYTGTVELSKKAFRIFALGAEARNLTLAQLVERVLETVATGGRGGSSLLDNVLDDL